MIERKVRKFGNSLGVILPTKVINRLQASEGNRLHLIKTGDGEYCGFG